MVDVDTIAQLIRPEIAGINAYHVPPASGMVKLDAMENPYQLPPEVEGQWLDSLRGIELNRYPDPAALPLKEDLARVMGVPEGMEILLGNGSDEIIQMLCMAVGGPGRTVLAPEPGFVMYKMIALFTGMEYVGVPLVEDFSLDLPAMLAAIEQHRPALTFIAYPNNPTGNLFDERQIVQLIEASPGLVVLDEAYHAFAQASFMDKLGHYDNLLVMRTVSKLGLAGLRLGFMAGPGAWLEQLDKVRLPYNINCLTQATAGFALQHWSVLQQQIDAICDERERVLTALQVIQGIQAWPSKTNFILFRLESGKADELHLHLLSQGILIKKLHGSNDALHGCLRVTVGKPEENTAFLSVLQDYTNAHL